jgi:hypothetical protein
MPYELISNFQRRKEGKFCASELVGIEPTSPAPEEQGMPALINYTRLEILQYNILPVSVSTQYEAAS